MSRLSTPLVDRRTARPLLAAAMRSGFVAVPVWMATAAGGWQYTVHQVARERAIETVAAHRRWVASAAPGSN